MKYLQTIMTLAIVAIINAGYLVYRWYELTFLHPESTSFCDINATYSCSDVLTHPAALVFGYPFPAVAMLVYPIIFVIAVLGYKKLISRHRTALALLSAGGILFNGYFMYQETFVVNAFCPLCLVCSGIIVTILILAIAGRSRTVTP